MLLSTYELAENSPAFRARVAVALYEWALVTNAEPDRKLRDRWGPVAPETRWDIADELVRYPANMPMWLNNTAWRVATLDSFQGRAEADITDDEITAAVIAVTNEDYPRPEPPQ